MWAKRIILHNCQAFFCLFKQKLGLIMSEMSFAMHSNMFWCDALFCLMYCNDDHFLNRGTDGWECKRPLKRLHNYNRSLERNHFHAKYTGHIFCSYDRNIKSRISENYVELFWHLKIIIQSGITSLSWKFSKYLSVSVSFLSVCLLQ